jgi:hypothetical protein
MRLPYSIKKKGAILHEPFVLRIRNKIAQRKTPHPFCTNEAFGDAIELALDYLK